MTQETWAALEPGAPVADPGPEGFVHCCDEHQIAGVVGRFFPPGAEVVAVMVDPTRLAAETRYEPGADRPDERFAHVYGTIPRSAVVEVRPAPVTPAAGP